MLALWSQVGLQEGTTVIMEMMNYFHDYMMMLLCVIMVFVSYVFCLVLMGVGLDKYTVESHMLELVWTVIPMVFLVFMALPSLYLLYMTEDVSNYGVSVKVLGHQWYWEYQYHGIGMDLSYDSYMLPGSSEGSYRLLDVDNRLVLPHMVGAMIMVSSSDVLHSWTVPSMGVKVDAVPGRLNYLNVLPVQYGVFYGQCSELCGTNHSFMPIVVEVVDHYGFVFHIENMSIYAFC